MNLYDIPHLNLSEPWWNQSLTEELTIAGKLNTIVGDLNISLISCSFVTFVNEKLRQDYNMPNLYEIVFEGNWTFDYMGNLVKDIYQDLNGDGIRDSDDMYGTIWGYNGGGANAFIHRQTQC